MSFRRRRRGAGIPEKCWVNAKDVGIADGLPALVADRTDTLSGMGKSPENVAVQALSFGPAAAHYDGVRPTYPAEAVRWAIGATTAGPDAVGTVVDLGAGTGLLTRVIREAVAGTVLAVEPDDLMRARLLDRSPGVRALAGSAESVPLGAAEADAVLAGQCYHWFDTSRAHPELARVIRPGGVFAPLWNIRDESVDWVTEFTTIVESTRPGGRRDDDHEPHDFGPNFGPVEHAEYRHSVPTDADGLVALAASRSYYLTATPDVQATLRDRIRELAASLPDEFPMPYVTHCYRAVRI